MAFTPSFVQVKDGLAAAKKLVAYYTGTAYAFANALLDGTGAVVNPATSDLQQAANGKLDDLLINTQSKSVNTTNPLTHSTSPYATGMVLGGVVPVANAARAGGSGLIQHALVAKTGSNLTAAVDLLVFNAAPATTFTDRAAVPDYGADLGKLVRVLQCADPVIDPAVQVLQSADAGVAFDLASGGTSLYLVPVLRGSETYPTTTAVTVNLAILQD